MIRLVALDLDGTLLDSTFHVAEPDREAIAEAQARGVHIVIDTTRWYEVALRTAQRLELTAPMVCHNGAHIKTPDGGSELLHLCIPTEVAREIASFCDEHGWETYTTVNGVTYMRTRWQAQIDPARLPKDMRVAKTHAEHVTEPATGILVFSEEAIREVPAQFARYDGQLAFPVGWSESQQPYLTVTVAGVDKGTGLRLVCERLGVPLKEAMAVGDAQPDVAMFEVAGIGVAMGNSIAEVKAKADAIAPSNTEGGVAWAIRRYVLEEG